MLQSEVALIMTQCDIISLFQITWEKSQIFKQRKIH